MSANAIKLLMLTGARRGEVLGANMGDVRPRERRLDQALRAHQAAQAAPRPRSLGPAVQLLVEMKAAAKARAEAEGVPPSPYVFPGPTGKPPHRDQADMGLGLPPGGARHGGAGAGREGASRSSTAKGEPKTEFNAECPDPRHPPFLRQHPRCPAGASLPLIGQMLGHTQVQTTQRYAHLFDESAAQGRRDGGRLRVAAPCGTNQ